MFGFFLSFTRVGAHPIGVKYVVPNSAFVVFIDFVPIENWFWPFSVGIFGCLFVLTKSTHYSPQRIDLKLEICLNKIPLKLYPHWTTSASFCTHTCATISTCFLWFSFRYKFFIFQSNSNYTQINPFLLFELIFISLFLLDVTLCVVALLLIRSTSSIILNVKRKK